MARDPAARFAEKLVLGAVPEHRPELGPCWLFTGAKRHGYGAFRVDGRMVPAHLYAAEYTFGPGVRGVPRDHLCHDWRTCLGGPTCPHRACAHPWHSRPTTPAANHYRSRARSAFNARKRRCRRGHRLAGANLYRHPKRGTRHCRACQSRRYARWADVNRRGRAPGDGQLTLAI